MGDSFSLSDNVFVTKDALFNFRGKPLSKREVNDFLGFGSSSFLRAFSRLSSEEQVAVRLRYGDDTLRWYRENKCMKKS